MKLATDGPCSHEVDSCRPWTGAARVYGDAVGGTWLGNTRSLASARINDDMRNDWDTMGVLDDFDVFWSIFRSNSGKLPVAWS